MSFFKPQVSFSSNFAPLFSFTKDNSSALFLSQTLYTFVTKRLLKHNFFRLLIAWVKILQIPHVRFKVNSSSIFVQFFFLITHNSSVNFKLINFLLWIKGSYQVPVLTLLSALVKIAIFHTIFETTV